MPVPIEITKQLSSETVASLRTHLDEHYLRAGLLAADVSNYAQGRQRAWLQAEAPLGPTRAWAPGVKDDKLWPWLLRNIWPEADVGLVAYGPVGIRPHRDASYAGFEAYAVNLGEVDAWTYEPGYDGYEYGPQVIRPVLTLRIWPGDVLRFNPKNRHAVINPAPDRWSINLWHVKEQFRAAMEAVLS